MKTAVMTLKSSNALKETFGRVKLKRSADEILKEIAFFLPSCFINSQRILNPKLQEFITKK